MRRSRFRRIPRWQRLIHIPVITFVVLMIALFIRGGNLNLNMLLCGVPLFLALILFWTFFFSQFIVPLNQISDRFQIFERLLFFPTPLHGQNILLENGERKLNPEEEGEENRIGISTAYLDTTSAAILATDVQLSRTIGPGVTFISYKEKLSDQINLRPRKSFLGPVESPNYSEDPFAAKTPGENYEERMKKRAETRGFTRDDIEVVPNIFVKFRLDSKWRSNGTTFGFNPDAVEAALTSRNVNTNVQPDATDRLADWAWLPGKIATDIWRELVNQFRLQQLFSIVEGGNRTGLVIINDILRQRMTQPTAATFQFDTNGQFSLGERSTSREFFILRRRGIRVSACTVLNLRFEQSIEKALIQNWGATWLNRARAQRENVLQMRNQQTAQAQVLGLQNFTSTVSQQLIQMNVPPQAPNANQTILRLLLQGSTNLYSQFPDLLRVAEEERKVIEEMQEWLL